MTKNFQERVIQTVINEENINLKSIVSNTETNFDQAKLNIQKLYEKLDLKIPTVIYTDTPNNCLKEMNKIKPKKWSGEHFGNMSEILSNIVECLNIEMQTAIPDYDIDKDISRVLYWINYEEFKLHFLNCFFDMSYCDYDDINYYPMLGIYDNIISSCIIKHKILQLLQHPGLENIKEHLEMLYIFDNIRKACGFWWVFPDYIFISEKPISIKLTKYGLYNNTIFFSENKVLQPTVLWSDNTGFILYESVVLKYNITRQLN